MRLLHALTRPRADDLIYHFEDCVLDTERRELRRRGSIVRLVEPQVFDLLEFLIRNRDRVVSRDDIFAAIWRGRVVSESVLSTRINAVRSLVGDTGSVQRLVRTYRRKGLRFVGAVREERRPAAVSESKIHFNNLAPILTLGPSIAVLPFAGIGDRGPQRRIADEIAEAIVLNLSRLHWLHVISRNLSVAYKNKLMDVRQIGQELNVRYVLGGHAYLLGDQIKITTELIDTTTGYQIWARSFEPKFASDTAQIRNDIASYVTGAIETRLYAAEALQAWRKRAGNLNAWECVVRAISLINTRQRSDWAAARGHLLKAIRIDPGYAQGYSLLSYVTTLGVAAGWRRKDSLDFALHTARKALLLEPDNPWAHVSLGFASAWGGRIEDAVLSYNNALTHDSRFAYAHTLLAAALNYMGHGQDASAELSKALRFSDVDLFTRGNIGVHNNTSAIACLVAERYRNGIEFGRKALVESPKLPTIHRIMIANYALNGELDEAKASLRTLRQLVPSTTFQSIVEWLPFIRVDERQKMTDAFRLVGLK